MSKKAILICDENNCVQILYKIKWILFNKKVNKANQCCSVKFVFTLFNY